MKLSAGFMVMRLNVLVGGNLRADAIKRVVVISKGTVAAAPTSFASARAGRDKGEAARGPEARTFLWCLGVVLACMAVAVPPLANLPPLIKPARIEVAVADEADVWIEGAIWGLLPFFGWRAPQPHAGPVG